MLLAVVLSAATALLSLPWRALGGWAECSISSEDYWDDGSDDFLPRIMQREWQRNYACPFPEGAESSASYKFVSPCMERFYSRPEIKSCLNGRRLIFLGDSLAGQQADSIVAMMGWNVSFLGKGSEGSAEHVNLPGGTQVRGPADCYRQDGFEQKLPTTRCFDIYETDFLVDGAAGAVEEGCSPTFEKAGPEFRARAEDEPKMPCRGVTTAGTVGGDISVHLRVFSKARGPNWLQSVVADFNGTTASDIVFVNFGAHYHEDVEDEFRADMSELLDDMGKLADTAAMVVWREYSPTHFPATNGSYEAFDALSPEEKGHVCCSGTPPEVYERNAWVEAYMEDNALSEKVKLLRIYRMSSFRGAAHRKCNVGEPTSPSQYDQHAHAVGSQCAHMAVFDCRHWSEPGVVEEWNRLVLNHICLA